MEEEISIFGEVYRKADIIESLKKAGCKVVLSETCDRYEIQEAMETLNLSQAGVFLETLLPKCICKAEPLARIRITSELKNQ